MRAILDGLEAFEAQLSEFEFELDDKLQETRFVSTLVGEIDKGLADLDKRARSHDWQREWLATKYGLPQE